MWLSARRPNNLCAASVPTVCCGFAKTIKGPLFPGQRRPAGAASKRLNRFLDEIGIVDPRKVTHYAASGARSAAGGRLPARLRWAILGHEEKTVAAGYGEGFPVPLLKKWIDKIGC